MYKKKKNVVPALIKDTILRERQYLKDKLKLYLNRHEILSFSHLKSFDIALLLLGQNRHFIEWVAKPQWSSSSLQFYSVSTSSSLPYPHSSSAPCTWQLVQYPQFPFTFSSFGLFFFLGCIHHWCLSSVWYTGPMAYKGLL